MRSPAVVMHPPSPQLTVFAYPELCRQQLLLLLRLIQSLKFTGLTQNLGQL
jgi:hypothetical protein